MRIEERREKIKMRWKVKVTNVNSRLRKRTGPSTSYRISSYMNPGDSGVVVETKTVGGATWYKWEKKIYGHVLRQVE